MVPETTKPWNAWSERYCTWDGCARRQPMTACRLDRTRANPEGGAHDQGTRRYEMIDRVARARQLRDGLMRGDDEGGTPIRHDRGDSRGHTRSTICGQVPAVRNG